MHFADQLLTAVAGASFVICYILGLSLGARIGKPTLWPAIVVTAVSFIARAESAPLGFWAIAAISAVHLGIGCLTALILKHTRPVGALNSSADTAKETRP